MTLPIISYRKFVVFYVILSVSIIGILMQCWVFNLLGYGWENIAVDSVISNLLLGMMCIAMLNNIKYYKPKTERYFYLILLSASVSILWLVSIKWILFYIFSDDINYQYFIRLSLPIRFCFAFLIIGFITILSWILLAVKDQKIMESRKLDAEKLAKDAELFKLRQQLQPHFLFNSLNSISALAGSKPEEARKMIQQLSDFLRGTIKSDGQQMLSLKEEIQYLQLYLDIEKVRFGHRLYTEIKADENTLALRLPTLLLQPVVENAIKFGLYDTIENVSILIFARMENEQLIITIQNPYDPNTAQKSGTGFGLTSIRRRLYLLYARTDLLETKSENNIFTSIVKIPQLHD